MDNNFEKHVSLDSLWKYTKEGKEPDSAELQHLIGCDQCIGSLGFCSTHESLDEVKQWLRLLD